MSAPDDEAPAPRRVLVTGAAGLIGRVLLRHLSAGYDLRALTRRPVDFPSFVADIADLHAIAPAFEGADAVVHLAAAVDMSAGWSEILQANIVGTYNVFEAARLAGVGQVVLASSNHAVGMYEAEAAPALYELEDSRSIDSRAELRPDSLYGVSKVFGEALGRFYSERFGMRVICLRIGTVLPDDDPAGPSVGEIGSWLNLSRTERYARIRATWLSHRDCADLVARCLEARDLGFAIVYGISNNPRQFWDISEARRLLGYRPRDAAPAVIPTANEPGGL